VLNPASRAALLISQRTNKFFQPAHRSQLAGVRRLPWTVCGGRLRGRRMQLGWLTEARSSPPGAWSLLAEFTSAQASDPLRAIWWTHLGDLGRQIVARALIDGLVGH